MITEAGILRSISNKVLLVGNGTISNPLVQVQKDFGTIVRFNNFVENRHVGYITDLWVSNAYKNIHKREKPFSYCFVPWTKDLPMSKHWERFERTTQTPIVFASSNHHFLNYFPRALLRHKFFPSTGFCFFAWLLYYKRIKPYFIGFDGLKSGHYWDQTHKHDHTLTGTMEHEIMKAYGILLKL